MSGEPPDRPGPESSDAEDASQPQPQPKPKKRRRPIGQSIGGVLFGFEQQILRTQPPPEELVRHARPDSPIPAGDGSLVTIELPDDPRRPTEG